MIRQDENGPDESRVIALERHLNDQIKSLHIPDEALASLGHALVFTECVVHGTTSVVNFLLDVCTNTSMLSVFCLEKRTQSTGYDLQQETNLVALAHLCAKSC